MTIHRPVWNCKISHFFLKDSENDDNVGSRDGRGKGLKINKQKSAPRSKKKTVNQNSSGGKCVSQTISTSSSSSDNKDLKEKLKSYLNKAKSKERRNKWIWKQYSLCIMYFLKGVTFIKLFNLDCSNVIFLLNAINGRDGLILRVDELKIYSAAKAKNEDQNENKNPGVLRHIRWYMFNQGSFEDANFNIKIEIKSAW